MDEVSIDVDHGFVDVEGKPETMLSLATKTTTLLIHLRAEGFDLFARVERRAWVDGSIRIGTCAGLPAFWSTDGDVVTCLVGPDDQGWGVAFAMPRATLPRIIVALQGDA